MNRQSRRIIKETLLPERAAESKVRVSDANVWSCSRYNSNNGWIANGNDGFAGNNNLYNRYAAVPLVNYGYTTWNLKNS